MNPLLYTKKTTTVDCLAIPRVLCYPEKLLLTQASPRKGPYSR